MGTYVRRAPGQSDIYADPRTILDYNVYAMMLVCGQAQFATADTFSDLASIWAHATGDIASFRWDSPEVRPSNFVSMYALYVVCIYLIGTVRVVHPHEI